MSWHSLRLCCDATKVGCCPDSSQLREKNKACISNEGVIDLLPECPNVVSQILDRSHVAKDS